MNINERRQLLVMVANCYEPGSLVGSAIRSLSDAITAEVHSDPERVERARKHGVDVTINFLGRAIPADWDDRS